MANIKIEKKGGSLWWLWALIALLIIGALIWFFVARNDHADRPVQTTAATQPNYVNNAPAVGDNNQQASAMASTDTKTGPITDLSTITASNDTSLVGRDVRLSHVPVGDGKIGDANFWIHDATGKKVYVVLNEVATPGTPTEGRVDVNKGSVIDLVGTIHAASEGAPKGAAAGSQTDPLPKGVAQYIYAQSAKVVS